MHSASGEYESASSVRSIKINLISDWLLQPWQVLLSACKMCHIQLSYVGCSPKGVAPRIVLLLQPFQECPVSYLILLQVLKKYPKEHKVYCSLNLNLEGGGGFVLLYFMKMLFSS